MRIENIIKWLFIHWIFATNAIAQYQPLIPLSYQSQNLPLIDIAIRDPEIVRNLVTDDLYFEQALQEIKAAQTELRTMRGPRKLELLEDIYLSYVNTSYYLEDVHANRKTSQTDGKQTAKKIKNQRKMVIYYATQFAKESRNQKKKARAIYHALTSQFLLGENPRSVFRGLQSIQKHLNKNLHQQANLLIGLGELSYGRLEQGENMVSGAARRLSSSGKIAAILALARSSAGINYQGRKVRRSQPRYQTLLRQATNQGRNLGPVDRTEILSFSIAIWQAAEGRKASWDRLPFDMKLYADLELSKAVTERSALQALSNRKYKSSIQRYQRLSQDYQASSLMGRIDQRTLDIYKLAATNHGQIASYQSALLSYEEKYLNDTYNRELSQAMIRDINGKHKALVDLVLGQAQKSGQLKQYRQQAIQVAERYLASSQGKSADYVSIKSKIANIHVLNSDHQKAVATYLDLKSRSQGKQAFEFLTLAIRSQTIIANWSVQVPWIEVSKGNRASRQLLANLYSEKYQSTNSWDDLAHIGLIWIQLGRTEEAYKAWLQKIQEQPNGIHAQYASGTMMASHHKAKHWQKLEDISRLSIKLKINPIFGRKSLNSYVYLADALYYGGKELFEKAQWAESAKKLKEFVDSFQRDQRRAEGMFYLAQAFHNNANHPESIETIMNLVNEYPSSGLIREALALGGQWSIPMAYEEQTIYFYQNFVDRFSSDQRTLDIRMILVELYMGRDLYGHAARIHMANSMDTRVNLDEQVKSALAVMEIEERFGDDKYARWGANRVKTIAKHNPIAMAEVLSFETRVAVKNKNIASVKEIESKLNKLPSDQREVSEALAQARFILAEEQAKTTKQEFFNLGLKNPSDTLEKQFALFVRVQKSYESVCEAGTSSFCGPAMMRLSETTKNTLDAIEEINIAATLDESIVNRFEKRKLSIITYVSSVSSKADDRALGITENGETTPDWSREIMWGNLNDWNFDEAHPTSGNGYIQWAPVIFQGSNDE